MSLLERLRPSESPYSPLEKRVLATLEEVVSNYTGESLPIYDESPPLGETSGTNYPFGFLLHQKGFQRTLEALTSRSHLPEMYTRLAKQLRNTPTSEKKEVRLEMTAFLATVVNQVHGITLTPTQINLTLNMFEGDTYGKIGVLPTGAGKTFSELLTTLILVAENPDSPTGFLTSSEFTHRQVVETAKPVLELLNISWAETEQDPEAGKVRVKTGSGEQDPRIIFGTHADFVHLWIDAATSPKPEDFPQVGSYVWDEVDDILVPCKRAIPSPMSQAEQILFNKQKYREKLTAIVFNALSRLAPDRYFPFEPAYQSRQVSGEFWERLNEVLFSPFETFDSQLTGWQLWAKNPELFERFYADLPEVNRLYSMFLNKVKTRKPLNKPKVERVVKSLGYSEDSIRELKENLRAAETSPELKALAVVCMGVYLKLYNYDLPEEVLTLPDQPHNYLKPAELEKLVKTDRDPRTRILGELVEWVNALLHAYQLRPGKDYLENDVPLPLEPNLAYRLGVKYQPRVQQALLALDSPEMVMEMDSHNRVDVGVINPITWANLQITQGGSKVYGFTATSPTPEICEVLGLEVDSRLDQPAEVTRFTVLLKNQNEKKAREVAKKLALAINKKEKQPVLIVFDNVTEAKRFAEKHGLSCLTAYDKTKGDSIEALEQVKDALRNGNIAVTTTEVGRGVNLDQKQPVVGIQVGVGEDENTGAQVAGRFGARGVKKTGRESMVFVGQPKGISIQVVPGKSQSYPKSTQKALGKRPDIRWLRKLQRSQTTNLSLEQVFALVSQRPVWEVFSQLKKEFPKNEDWYNRCATYFHQTQILMFDFWMQVKTGVVRVNSLEDLQARWKVYLIKKTKKVDE